MSCYYLNPSETTLSIPSFETVDSTTFYTIRVTCWQKIEWTVRHRYSDFHELHEKLQKEIAIAKDLLPKKKIIKDNTFLMQRQQDLEKYLQTLAHMVQHQIPLVFVEFLDFHKYDVVFLLQKLAMDFSQKFNNNKTWTFTILELHAISSRLLLPCPSFELQNSAFDFSHILDFCSQVETLKIVPSTAELATKEEFLQHLINPIGNSNILPSTLTFDLSPFTSVTSLELCGIVPQNISKCDAVKSTAVCLSVHNTRVQNVQQILLPESIHDSFTFDQSWSKVKIINFGNNDIWTIDSAMQLVPNVEEVHLNDNRLRTVTNLSSLHHLSHLNLSGNLIDSLVGWYLELGNIQTLNLSCNKLKSLAGLNRIRSLRSIDLSWNQIQHFDEVDEIAQLPVIENVGLNGTLLALEVDYRPRVLARFAERCCEIVLDNERCSPNEIDKAMVLAALRKTKIG